MTTKQFRVFVNDEGQYGILPSHMDTPNGWKEAGFTGAEEDCIAHVDSVWLDITPKSVQARVNATR
jgi:MbtH protein